MSASSGGTPEPPPPHPSTGPASGTRPPLSVVVASIAWLVLGGLLIAVWFGLDQLESAADEPAVDTITDALGSDAVATSSGGSGSVMPLLLGAGILYLAVCLLLRRGWVQWLLILGGFAGVVAIATTGRWVTLLVAMVLVLVGAVAGTLSSAKQYSTT